MAQQQDKMLGERQRYVFDVSEGAGSIVFTRHLALLLVTLLPAACQADQHFVWVWGAA